MKNKLLKFSLIAGLLMACQAIAQPALRIVADNEVALAAAVTVDVVFVFNDAVVAQLPFEQFAWMSARNQVQAQFADQLVVVSSELLPGSVVNLALPENAHQATSVLVFASHEDPVAEAIDISVEMADAASITLQIEDWGIDVIAE